MDGQWTQLRQYHAARTLSPLCALCGSEEHRHARCPELQGLVPCNVRGPVRSAVQKGKLWKHEPFAALALLPKLNRASAR